MDRAEPPKVDFVLVRHIIGSIPKGMGFDRPHKSDAMHFTTILNRDGGTLRTTDLAAFEQKLRTVLGDAGHEVDVEVVDGPSISKALDHACAKRGVDVVLVGGGDGTVSAAAGKLMNTKKALAVLPAGTMNLFARGLGIPLGLDAAVEAFADGTVRPVDIATANDRPFVHQFSIGMHAKMVHLREKMEFRSRLGKIRASAKAAFSTLLDPPSMKVELVMDDTKIVSRTIGVGVTNNLLQEGTLPFAEKPDGGVLGIYVTVAEQKPELVRLALNMMRGRWKQNPHVEIHETEQVTINLLSRNVKRRAVIDGELTSLDLKTTIRIHKKALNVLVPGKS